MIFRNVRCMMLKYRPIFFSFSFLLSSVFVARQFAGVANFLQKQSGISTKAIENVSTNIKTLCKNGMHARNAVLVFGRLQNVRNERGWRAMRRNFN